MDGWLALLVPLVTLFGVIVRQYDFGLRRRLVGHLGLLERPVPEATKPLIEELIVRESAELVARDTRRLTRRLDGSNLAAIVIVAVVGGGITYGLWQLDHWSWRVLAGLVGVFAFLMIAIGGLPQLFTSKHSDSETATDRAPIPGPPPPTAQ